MRTLARTALSLALVASTACDAITGGQICTTEARPAVSVDVRDSTTGAPAVRNAIIVASLGAFADTASSSIFDGPYGLAHERPGTYTVTVQKQGYRQWSLSGVRVTKGECHVRTASLVARLQP